MSQFVLGSGSAGRRMILENAGLDFEIRRPQVDEESLKTWFMEKSATPLEDLALTLARAKAEEVSRNVELPVLGADQILICDGRVFSKPADMEEARRNLRYLRGRTHRLISALAVAEDGNTTWTCVDEAHMTMRGFSDAFLERYLDMAGENVLKSVGCYQIEGPGIQLFEKIDGDWFTIVGLPILPFLDWLRLRGLLAE